MLIFLLSGYRNRLNFLDCMRSLFLLHNETINIWSHLLGFAFFAGLFVHDLVLVIPAVTDDGKTVITKTDFLVLFILLICYQVKEVIVFDRCMDDFMFFLYIYISRFMIRNSILFLGYHDTFFSLSYI